MNATATTDLHFFLAKLLEPIISDILDTKFSQYENKFLPTNTTPTPPPAEQIFDVPLLSQYLGQAESTTYTNMPMYPRRKMGKSWRFLKSEIDEWLRSNKVKSKSELREELRQEAENHLQNLKAKK